MYWRDINVWGVVALVVLWGVALAVSVLADDKVLKRYAKAAMVMVVQMGALGASIWAVFHYDRWWTIGVFVCVLLLLTSVWCLYRIRILWRQLAWPVMCALFGGLAVLGAALLVCMNGKYVIPLYSVLAASLAVSLVETARTYISSLRHTESHRRYLMANGAKHFESLRPSLKRAMRAAIQPELRKMASPLLVVMPMLFCGLLLGGVGPATAVVLFLLLTIANYVSAVLSAVIFLWVADGLLFDKQGNFIALKGKL